MSLGPAPSRRMANASGVRERLGPIEKLVVARLEMRSSAVLPIQADRLANRHGGQPRKHRRRVGWRRMSCIHAKEQASSTLASDVLTTPRTRPRKAAWCLAKSSASSPQSGAGGTRPPGVSATPPQCHR